MKELKKLIHQEIKKQEADAVAYMLQKTTFAEKERQVNNYYYTKSLYKQYKKYNAVSESEKVKVLKLLIKDFYKTEHLKKLETLENVELLKGFKIRSINIITEWKDSKTWGKNPSVKVAIYYTRKNLSTGVECCEGFASGCGYCKESSAIAQAFNSSQLLKALLIKAKEKALKQGEALPYGSGYGAIPYYSQGVGVNCLMGLLEYLGAKTSEQHGKNSSAYQIAFDSNKGRL